MVSEIEKQKMLSYEETIEKQKAQMQYLQLQLKPHFYLNGLKTLNALTLARDWEKSQELILHISEQMCIRYSVKCFIHIYFLLSFRSYCRKNSFFFR